MKKALWIPLALAGGFLLACNMCNISKLIEELERTSGEPQGTYEEPGGTYEEPGRSYEEPDYEEMGLSIVLPDGWETIEYRPSSGPSEMEEAMIIFGHVDGLQATVTCMMYPEMFSGKSADEVAHYMVFAPDVDHPPTIDKGRITISGVKGYEASYVMEEDELYTYRYIAVATEEQSRIFTIEFVRYGRRGFSSQDKAEMKRFLKGVKISSR